MPSEQRAFTPGNPIMINSSQLLADLQSKSTSRTTLVKKLEDDLRKRCDREPEVDAPLKEQYSAAKAKKRTALTYKAWRDEQLTQIAVAWVLACVFVRFLEDNELVEVPKLSGPGERLRRARDEHELFFQRHPTSTEREFLLEVFEETGRLPGMKEFFDRKHNPLWLAAPSGDACRELWLFWQKTDPETGALRHDFTDQDWNTRFLGDLYQDLSEAARKKYALLQTPEFVEEFILDRTLTPAIETFGYREVRMIDPTCGSGHFLLGGFQRIFRLWQNENPEENPRVLAQRALDAVKGVDLNPFAVAIARFRLLLAALRVCGPGPGARMRLRDAPDFHIRLAVGDSLIHGARFDSQGNPYVVERETLFGGQEAFKDEHAHFFDTEDAESLHRILGRQYHAVVGNPPYITVKDKALNQLYRDRYDACSGKYALSVPFMERFFDLAVAGSREERRPAGFTGQITANSFMKREFGKKLIEEHIPKWDLTHVLDTSGAYIPGHGTPTVILFGRNAKPQAATVRTVMGIKGEPATPDDPAQGRVWSAIVAQVDRPGSESEFVSAADTEREKFHKHPWSVGGGGAVELKETIEGGADRKLGKLAKEIGITSVTGEDDLYLWPDKSSFDRSNLESNRELVTGDLIRDWDTAPGFAATWMYDDKFDLKRLDSLPKTQQLFWSFRAAISRRKRFGTPMLERGLTWYEWQELYDGKLRVPLSITFAFVATHNHFVLDRGGKVFKQSAPVIKLPADATEDDHLRLLGLLNSSAACFWMKQVFYPKATATGDISTEKGKPEANRYEIAGTGLKDFPIPQLTKSDLSRLLGIIRELDRLGRDLAKHTGEGVMAQWESERGDLRKMMKEGEETSALIRQRMIYLQEELDWLVYALYGLLEHRWPVDPEARIDVDDRPFAWSSDEMTESIAANLRETYSERRRLIKSLPMLQLIENRVCKRLWLGRQGVYGSASGTYKEKGKRAVGRWLLTRLESYFFEGDRVCPPDDESARAARTFTAATRPHLVSANQLADIVQSDARFLEAAEIYAGASGFSVPKLVRDLVAAESVPYLPVLRYKDSGLRKRHDWEETWALQRKEDEVEEEVKGRNVEGRMSEDELKRLIRREQQARVGDIPVPPKYSGKDFLKASYWKLRGKLDVPKERWISYPGAERAGDDSLILAWAGWDHLQQAQALSEYFIDAKDHQGWPPERLKPLLAGLADLVPWLKQWHNDTDPNLGMGLGDYFAGFLEEQCRGLETTVQEVDAGRFTWGDVARPSRRTTKTTKIRRTKIEPAPTIDWQDAAFELLAPKRQAISEYRVRVWPELLRQVGGDLEFETFRKAYWLLSEPEEFERQARLAFSELPSDWWRSRAEQLEKEDFLETLKGSVRLGEIRLWKEDGVRFVRWTGTHDPETCPEAVDDARVALQIAGQWQEEGEDPLLASWEEELEALESR